MYQHPETALRASKEHQQSLRQEVAEERLARQIVVSPEDSEPGTQGRRAWWRRNWRTAFLRAEPARHEP